MKHKFILFFAVMILWVCYFGVVVRSYVDYSTYVSTTIAWYEQHGIPREYIELYPYMQYGYSGVIIASGFIYLVLTITLGIYLHKERLSKPKFSSLALAFLLIVPVMMLQSPAKVAITASLSEVHVECCMYFDDECTDANQREWVHIGFFAHNAGISTYDKFKDYYNIIFVCENGHDTFWNSADGISNPYYLLQEAIHQAGGVWDAANDWWIWQDKLMLCSDGIYRWINCLIIICNQPMDMVGFSPPMWNAMIINFNPQTYECMHELSHQFWCEHCGGFCCMNPNLGLLRPIRWCGTCSDFIVSHREKWGNQLIIGTSNGGTTNHGPGTYIYESGATVTVTAIPISGHTFFCWLLDSRVIVYGNPMTITMNTNHRLRAYFLGKRGGGDTKFYPR